MGITSISEDNGRIVVQFGAGVSIPPDALRPLAKAFPEHIWESTRVKLEKGRTSPIELVSEFLRLIGRSLTKTAPAPRTTVGVR